MRSKNVVREFLFHTNLNLQAKNNFNNVNEVRYKVADMYKKHLYAIEYRTGVMDEVFDKEIGYLTKYYQKRKKGVN